MEHPFLFLSEISDLIGFGHFGHENPHVLYSLFVIAFLIIAALIMAKGIALIPTKRQNILEIVVGGLENFIVSVTGPEGRAFVPFLVTIFIYILFSNLIGLVPGCFSPTANINTTLSLAVCVFVYTHFLGIKHHGIKYIKHFLGPVPALAPLMFPIELIGHLARVMSLSIRLFGNIYGKEMVLGILFGLAGFFLVPLPILFLGILVSVLQALVFMLLSTIYFVGSMEHAH